jgi:hypothetical protein
VVLAIPQPAFGQSGRRNPPDEVSAGGASPVLCRDQYPLTTQPRPRTRKAFIRAPRTAAGAIVNETRCCSALDQPKLGVAFLAKVI